MRALTGLRTSSCAATPTKMRTLTRNLTLLLGIVLLQSETAFAVSLNDGGLMHSKLFQSDSILIVLPVRALAGTMLLHICRATKCKVGGIEVFFTIPKFVFRVCTLLLRGLGCSSGAPVVASDCGSLADGAPSGIR